MSCYLHLLMHIFLYITGNNMKLTTGDSVVKSTSIVSNMFDATMPMAYQVSNAESGMDS